MNWRYVWPCVFGLRCARCVASADGLLRGFKLVTEYTCGECGVRYRGNGWRRHKVAA